VEGSCEHGTEPSINCWKVQLAASLEGFYSMELELSQHLSLPFALPVT
jgi:hypothetical protein